VAALPAKDAVGAAVMLDQLVPDRVRNGQDGASVAFPPWDSSLTETALTWPRLLHAQLLIPGMTLCHWLCMLAPCSDVQRVVNHPIVHSDASLRNLLFGPSHSSLHSAALVDRWDVVSLLLSAAGGEWDVHIALGSHSPASMLGQPLLTWQVAVIYERENELVCEGKAILHPDGIEAIPPGPRVVGAHGVSYALTSMMVSVGAKWRGAVHNLIKRGASLTTVNGPMDVLIASLLCFVNGIAIDVRNAPASYFEDCKCMLVVLIRVLIEHEMVPEQMTLANYETDVNEWTEEAWRDGIPPVSVRELSALLHMQH